MASVKYLTFFFFLQSNKKPQKMNQNFGFACFFRLKAVGDQNLKNVFTESPNNKNFENFNLFSKFFIYKEHKSVFRSVACKIWDGK